MSDLLHLPAETLSIPKRPRAAELLLRWLGSAVALSSVLILVRYLCVALRLDRPIAYDGWLVLATLPLGAVIAALWSRLSPRDSERLHFLFQYATRVAFAPILLQYGVSKVYGGQFYPSFLSTLDSTLSEITGNGLVWAFFARSYPYTLFVAAAEVLAALLLLSRRTQLLGGAMTAAVFANVVVIDFSYEVGGLIGVKLAALVGLAAGTYLVAADEQRLRALLGAAVPAQPHPFASKARLFVLAQVIFVFGWSVPDRLRSMSNVGKFLHSETPVHGIWDVRKSDVPTPGWSRLYFDDQRATWLEKTERDSFKRLGAVRQPDGLKSMEYHVGPADALELSVPSLGKEPLFVGTWRLENAKTLHLTGTLGGKPATLTLEAAALRPRGEEVW